MVLNRGLLAEPYKPSSGVVLRFRVCADFNRLSLDSSESGDYCAESAQGSLFTHHSLYGTRNISGKHQRFCVS